MPHDSENIRRSKESLRKPRPKSDLPADESAQHDEGRSRNTQTGRSRIPWGELDDRKKHIRYAQAVRAFDNGVLKNHPGTFERFAATQEALDAHQKSAQPKPPKQPATGATASRMPHLFGRGGRDRVLICLAINGPMHVRHIARTIGSDSHKVWNTIEALRAINVVVKREEDGGRKYAALNRDLPIYRPLCRLLIAMDRYWPVPRAEFRTAPRRMPYHDTFNPNLLTEMFQGPVRTHVLLLVAAVGAADQKTIGDLLRLAPISGRLALDRWERQGVLHSIRLGNGRFYALDPGFEVAPELKALLREIIRHSRELQQQRAIWRAQMRTQKLAPHLPLRVSS